MSGYIVTKFWMIISGMRLLFIDLQMDQKNLTKNHVEVIKFILAELTWLHHEGENQVNNSFLNLTPRLLETLRYLLLGYSDKRIAEIMNLSHHTILKLCGKKFYKFLMCTSRSELLAMFIKMENIEVPK